MYKKCMGLYDVDEFHFDSFFISRRPLTHLLYIQAHINLYVSIIKDWNGTECVTDFRLCTFYKKNICVCA